MILRSVKVREPASKPANPTGRVGMWVNFDKRITLGKCGLPPRLRI